MQWITERNEAVLLLVFVYYLDTRNQFQCQETDVKTVYISFVSTCVGIVFKLEDNVAD